MKVIISAAEAMEKGIWVEIMHMFGREETDDIWPKEEFILNEKQARELKLII